MASDYSSEGLLRFLRDAAVAGRMPPATARSRSKAAQALLPHLAAEEAADLRGLDLARFAQRLADLGQVELRGEVVELYLQRLYEALDDFFRFNAAPDSFETVRGQPAVPFSRPAAAAQPADERALEAVRLSFNHHRPDVFPIPLERDRVVYLHGVPADLTSAEARRIARVIRALAVDGGSEDEREP